MPFLRDPGSNFDSALVPGPDSQIQTQLSVSQKIEPVLSRFLGGSWNNFSNNVSNPTVTQQFVSPVALSALSVHTT